jgi:hypothetical protein
MNYKHILEDLAKLEPNRDEIKNQIEKTYAENFFQNLVNYGSANIGMFKDCMNTGFTYNMCKLASFGPWADRDAGDYQTLQQIKTKYNYDNLDKKNQTEKLIKNIFEDFTSQKRCEVISRYLNNKYTENSNCEFHDLSGYGLGNISHLKVYRQ